MKYSTGILAALAVGAPLVAAFPAAMYDKVARVADYGDLEKTRRDFMKEKRSTFNPSKQYISTSGQNAFVAPDFDAGDQRGPCPGLNALANHGYLPHNGVAGMNDIIDAVTGVYGMAVDLATFLAVYGTVFDGNPVSLSPGYSIGGEPPSDIGNNILGGLGLLGKPQGLSGSHNKYESDASTTRGDLFVYGNGYELQIPYFQQYYDALPENTPADEQYKQLADFHLKRFEDSVNTNEYFLYSPFAGVLVTPAGWAFPCRMMANHSDEYPDGYLSRENLKTFFAITGDSGDFQYKMGHERIPENWYRRPVDDYSIPAFLLDVLDHGIQHPQLLSIGGNIDGPNTFFGVDIGNLTGGVIETEQLTQGNNLLCVVLRVIQAVQPDVLGSTLADPSTGGLPLTDQISDLVGQYSCPQIHNVDINEFKTYPGYTKYGSAI